MSLKVYRHYQDFSKRYQAVSFNTSFLAVFFPKKKIRTDILPKGFFRMFVKTFKHFQEVQDALHN